jgi:hypothetical protein
VPAAGYKEPTITTEAKARLVSLAYRKAKYLGDPREVWTTRALGSPRARAWAGRRHTCLAGSGVCKNLNEREVKPHKVRSYPERRDTEFKQKIAEFLCAYRQVKLIKETAAAAKEEFGDAGAIVCYDEKPGIQAIATTAPDLSPEPGKHATFARDHSTSATERSAVVVKI